MKKLLLLLPVLGGIVLGEIFFSSSPTKIISPEVEAPSGRKETKLASSLTTNNQIVSDHLVKSQALFSKAIEISSQNDDSSQNDRIVQLINEAITEVTEAIIVNPRDPRGYGQRGKIYKAIEKYLAEALTAALADYQQAVRLDPRQIDYYKEIAAILVKLDRKAEAVGVWQNCVYINPTEAQAWYQLAKLQTELGELKGAKESYQRLLAFLVEGEQKETVRKEVEILDNLLAQVQDLPTPTKETEKNEIIFPSEPPRLEAKAVSKVIIAASEEEKTEEESGETNSNALSGTAVLPAGEKELKIENQNLKIDSQVYLAAESDLQNEVLRVGIKGENWFTVTISRPLENEVSFRWWIIN